MTPARQAHLMKVVRETKCLEEMHGVRLQLSHQQEITPEIYTAMRARVEDLAKAERVKAAAWWARRT